MKYSPTEERVLKIIRAVPRGSALSTPEIARRMYRGREEPYNARQVALFVMNNLRKKTKLNREKFRIEKSKRCGPAPIHFWWESV